MIVDDGNDESAPRAPPPFRWPYLLVAAAVVFQLFYVGAQPVAAGLIPAPWDKLAHLAVYSLITLLLWIGTAGRIPLTVIATVVVIGAADELHQAQLAGRFADTVDFLVDACAVTGTVAAIRLHARRTTQGR